MIFHAIEFVATSARNTGPLFTHDYLKTICAIGRLTNARAAAAFVFDWATAVFSTDGQRSKAVGRTIVVVLSLFAFLRSQNIVSNACANDAVAFIA